jgi:hypothetical protein
MNRKIAISIIVSIATLLPVSALMAKGPAPEGRTYFITVIGLDDEPYQVSADCLTFGATEACSLNETCLSWQRIEGTQSSSKESGFSLFGELEDNSLSINLDGQGRVNSRGAKSSIAVASRASAMGTQVNFAFSGRQVGQARCTELVEEFYSGTASP